MRDATKEEWDARLDTTYKNFVLTLQQTMDSTIAFSMFSREARRGMALELANALAVKAKKI